MDLEVLNLRISHFGGPQISGPLWIWTPSNPWYSFMDVP